MAWGAFTGTAVSGTGTNLHGANVDNYTRRTLPFWRDIPSMGGLNFYYDPWIFTTVPSLGYPRLMWER